MKINAIISISYFYANLKKKVELRKQRKEKVTSRRYDNKNEYVIITYIIVYINN